MQYIGGGNFTGVEGALGQPPGSEFLMTYQGDSAHPYLDLTSITKNQVPYPLDPPVLPVQQIPLTSRTQPFGLRLELCEPVRPKPNAVDNEEM